MKTTKLMEGLKIYAPNHQKLYRLLSVGIQAIRLNEDCPYKMVAVGLSKSKEIIIGYPKLKTHPFFKEYHERHFSYSRSVHAEGDLVLKAIDKELTTILVVRISRKTNSVKDFFRMARPCDSCSDVLYDYQRKADIYYTTSDGSILPFVNSLR